MAVLFFMKSAQEIIEKLSLTPHPEGGYFRETFRDTNLINGRSASTAIYYLLAKGQRSHWHRVDVAETWHWYDGAPLALSVKLPDKVDTYTLGSSLSAGELPQLVVPANSWQSAESLGEWTLVGCTAAPGFEFSGFEMAPPGWHP